MSINSITGNTLLTSGSFPPVRAASTGSPLNPATGGLLVVDGVQLVAGDRVLAKDEASAVNNGIYAAATGPWMRTADASNNQQFFSGMAVTVALGNVNAGQRFICTTTDDPVVVGTSSITFVAQSIVATATQSATSATSFAVGTGSKTFAIQAGKAFAVNQWVIVQETSNPANQMLGQITAYAGTSLTVNVTAVGGSGTHADWTIVLTNSAAAAGYQPPVGSGNVTGPGSSTAGHIATFADATGKVIQDGGTLVGSANTITPSMFANAAVGFALGMLNGTLTASVAGNALTIAIKTLAGVDPSSSDPVFFLIRDASAGYVVTEQTAALSITVPSTATLGTVNNQANRIWAGVFNNAGTAVLGVYNSLSGTNILPWDETSTANGTAIAAGSNSAQVWFTNGTVTGKAFRVLGYVESTQAVAGTWASSPTKVQLLGPGAKRPGEVVQTVSNFVAGQASTASASFVALAGENISVTPSSAANVIRVESVGTLSISAVGAATIQLSRGTTANTGLFGCTNTNSPGSALFAPASVLGYDTPNTTSAQTYAVQGKTTTGTLTYGGGTIIAATELQI
jgi:hypothetical protein